MNAKPRDTFIFGALLLVTVLAVSTWSLIQSSQVDNTQTNITTKNEPNQPIVLVSALPYHDRVYNLSLGGFLAFNLTVRNVASIPIYYAYGCGGSSLQVGEVFPPYGVHPDQPPGPSFGCATPIVSIGPGLRSSIVSGNPLRIIHSGSFAANLTLNWGWNDSYVLNEQTMFTVPFNVQNSSCSEPSSLPILPAGPSPWFSARVFYGELWNASVTGYSGSTQVFHECAIGFGDGYMLFPNWNSSGPAKLVITAKKWVPTNNALFLSVNGNFTSAVLPDETATIVETLQSG